ncbi:hypothetical protein OS493_038928 [Desmophyllum pertusum]|uniref:Uncharacterized protein n=1 Tax=Desmophyllum pertusum TaxID=174260 RepID=A0A9X0CWB0_9CNID|nr:hypothetical protein OS493_038928 [Desmophyllum pertusum]
MYIKEYAKDNVEIMMISPVKSEEKKGEGKVVNDELKENLITKETVDVEDQDKDQYRSSKVKPIPIMMETNVPPELKPHNSRHAHLKDLKGATFAGTIFGD